MGIPVYFKTIISQYQDDILIKSELENVSLLCFDLNCLIHPCCREIISRGSNDEKEMIDYLLESIESLISLTKAKNIYIAIDGIPPKAKMKQQRQRRHRSALENSVWDTNAISPGTYFMDRLNARLHQCYDNADNVVISDSSEVGEGEHKIFAYLNNIVKKDNIVIYGLDADLIQLGLVNKYDHLYLLRERTQYNIEDCENDYIYLSIRSLENHIKRDINMISKINDRVIINDYIFLCMLLGNDFINHMESLNLRYRGLESLLDIYKSLQDRYQGYYQLIIDNTTDGSMIHLPFFRELMTELAKNEAKRINSIDSQRTKQSKRLLSIYGHEYHEFLNYSKRYKISESDPLPLTMIYDFLKEYEQSNQEESFSEMTLHLPLLRVRGEYEKDVDEDSYECCQDFLDSLMWTTHYYFKGCCNWKWHTKYSRAPSCHSLSEYLNLLPYLDIAYDPNPLSINEMLRYIFPKRSHILHDHKIIKDSKEKDIDLRVDTKGCRYLWEAPLLSHNY